MIKGLFGNEQKAELTPEVEKMIDQAEFLVRNVKKQMRNNGIAGSLSYQGQLTDSIAQVNKDIELIQRGKATEKTISALAGHTLTLRTCAENLIDHFEEEFAIQSALRRQYIKEKQASEEKQASAGKTALWAERERTAGQRDEPVRILSGEEDATWEALFRAAVQVQGSREISEYASAGETACAVLAGSGKIYTGVSVDMTCALGTCAEKNALQHMITEGEHTFTRILTVGADGRILPPCGSCREFMAQLMPAEYKNVQIMLDMENGRTVTLGEILPVWQF